MRGNRWRRLERFLQSAVLGSRELRTLRNFRRCDGSCTATSHSSVPHRQRDSVAHQETPEYLPPAARCILIRRPRERGTVAAFPSRCAARARVPTRCWRKAPGAENTATTSRHAPLAMCNSSNGSATRITASFASKVTLRASAGSAIAELTVERSASSRGSAAILAASSSACASERTSTRRCLRPNRRAAPTRPTRTAKRSHAQSLLRTARHAA
jgi:hypothetical protein